MKTATLLHDVAAPGLMAVAMLLGLAGAAETWVAAACLSAIAAALARFAPLFRARRRTAPPPALPPLPWRIDERGHLVSAATALTPDDAEIERIIFRRPSDFLRPESDHSAADVRVAMEWIVRTMNRLRP